MTDQLISFETAKLAIEKGFSIPYYFHGDDYFAKYDYPTQSLLQRWLRDKRIHVQVAPVDDWNNWYFQVWAEDLMAPFFLADESAEWQNFKSYEEALEAGLVEALTIVTKPF